LNDKLEEINKLLEKQRKDDLITAKRVTQEILSKEYKEREKSLSSKSNILSTPPKTKNDLRLLKPTLSPDLSKKSVVLVKYDE